MKNLLIIAFLLLNIIALAQKPCEISADVIDSIGTYKTTKDYLIYEKNFAKTHDYIYFFLAKTDRTPTLNVQFINKSDGFVKAKCVDKNSKLYFKLQNGKIITMVAIDKDDCGTMLIDQLKNNNRILQSQFLFLNGNLEDLKSSPISFMKLRFMTGEEDYVFTKSLKSEMDGLYYEPENYFINYLKCIE